MHDAGSGGMHDKKCGGNDMPTPEAAAHHRGRAGSDERPGIRAGRVSGQGIKRCLRTLCSGMLRKGACFLIPAHKVLDFRND
jgi:hypothetical protein